MVEEERLNFSKQSGQDAGENSVIEQPAQAVSEDSSSKQPEQGTGENSALEQPAQNESSSEEV